MAKWLDVKGRPANPPKKVVIPNAKREPLPEPTNAPSEVTRTPSGSVALLTDEDVRAAYTVRDAVRYLAQVEDVAEVQRLAALDSRGSLADVYEARIAELEG